MRHVQIVDIGRLDYNSAWDLQRELFLLRSEGKISDLLLLTEHDPVYTVGKSGNDNHVLANEKELYESGVAVVHTDRGGDVTYHGPGQLVGYPIMDLNEYYHDLHRYLRDLEDVIMRSLSEYGINGERDNKFTGVWVGGEKIAALGVKVSRWVTMHGFALNVNTDLSYFDRIIPCGIFHKGVTSLGRLVGSEMSLVEVGNSIVRHFEAVFGAEVRRENHASLLQQLEQFRSEKKEWLQIENHQ